MENLLIKINKKYLCTTYRHKQLLHTIWGHTVEVSEMQLQVNLVTEDILTQWAADDGLHGMLGHDVQL